MNEKIKELADGIFVNCQACLLEEEAEMIAKYVIEEMGYRKASDVAREIFDDLEKAGITTKVIMYGLVIRDKTDAYCEIKKKYLGSEWVESCVEAAKKAIEDYKKKHESESGE